MIAPAAHVFTADVLGNLLPREQVRTWDWACEHAYNRDGRPFDPDGYPQHEGVYDAFDDPRYRFVVLQWATRLGKTFIGQTCFLKLADTDPRPLMFVSASENAASDTVTQTLVPMLRYCPRLREQVPERVNRHSLNLWYCRVKVAWSGSHTRLADASVWFQHDSEVDKWSTDKSTEADPLELAIERTKEYPDRKVLIESTPGLKGHSRIAVWLARSTNCRRYVPCPWCHRYQVLQFERIVWDKTAEDRHDSELARRTARYVCEHCGREIHDEHRPRMFRQGVWVPEGCHVRRGRVCGTPKQQTDIWGSQLSSLYAGSLTWGDVAWKFLTSKDRPGETQNFVNSWLGELWEPHRSKSTPEMLADRLRCNVLRCQVPSGASFVTCGVDVQGDLLKYVVCAWGVEERGWLIDYGLLDGWEDLQVVLDQHYPREDTGQSTLIALTLIDSRYRQPEVVAFCRQHCRTGRAVIPLQGQSAIGALPFRLSTRSADGRKIVQGRMTSVRLDLVEINTNYYQDLIQHMLDDGVPGEPGGFGIIAEAADDMDFLAELLNEVQSGKLNTRGYTELLWVKKSETEPNDYRDALRYARCAADVYARGNWSRKSAAPAQRPSRPVPVAMPTAPTASEPEPADPPTASQAMRAKSSGRANFVKRPGGWLRRSW